MDLVLRILAAPEMRMFWYILGFYLGLYALVFALSWIRIALRRGGVRPHIDRIVHVTTLWCLVLYTLWPIYIIFDMLLRLRLVNAWYLLPYGLVALINVVTIFTLWGKRRIKTA